MLDYAREMAFDFYPNADGLLIESSDYAICHCKDCGGQFFEKEFRFVNAISEKVWARKPEATVVVFPHYFSRALPGRRGLPGRCGTFLRGPGGGCGPALLASLLARHMGVGRPASATRLVSSARFLVHGCPGPALRHGFGGSAILIALRDVFRLALLLVGVFRLVAAGHAQSPVERGETITGTMSGAFDANRMPEAGLLDRVPLRVGAITVGPGR